MQSFLPAAIDAVKRLDPGTDDPVPHHHHDGSDRDRQRRLRRRPGGTTSPPRTSTPPTSPRRWSRRPTPPARRCMPYTPDSPRRAGCGAGPRGGRTDHQPAGLPAAAAPAAGAAARCCRRRRWRRPASRPSARASERERTDRLRAPRPRDLRRAATASMGTGDRQHRRPRRPAGHRHPVQAGRRQRVRLRGIPDGDALPGRGLRRAAAASAAGRHWWSSTRTSG